MKNALEKLQALGKSRLIRFGVKTGIVLITFLMILWPHLRRPDAFLLSGKEAYYHISNGTLSIILEFLGKHMGLEMLLLVKLVPLIVGVLSILLFYAILKKLKLSYVSIVLATLILIVSPSFVFLFSTLNAYAFVSLIMLLALYLLLNKRYVLGVLSLYLLPFFGIIPAVLGVSLVLFYSLKRNKFMIFLFSIPSLIILYFFHVAKVPSYGTGIIYDLGGRYGLGFFIVLLSLFGLKFLWQKKYKYIVAYSTIVALCIFSVFEIRMLALLNFLLATLAALGLIDLMKTEWRSELIKKLTILIMIYGLIFSGLSYVNFVGDDLPNGDIAEMMDHLETLPGDNVFSQDSRKYWIEYSGKEFVADENLFYTNDIEQALAIINAKEINYIWIDEEMEEKIWADEEEDLQFLIKYNNNFRINKENDYVTLWEVVEEDDINS